MGDSIRGFHSREPKSCSVASAKKGLSEKTLKCILSMKQGIQGNGAAGEIGIFLLTTATLEIVRRFSRAKCPFIWRGLQALQLLCYPPFTWMQRWTPFKCLVKSVQPLSRPLLVLSIATVFSDEFACANGTLNSCIDPEASSESQPETSSELLSPDSRSGDEAPIATVSEKWLLDLRNELDKQGITLPERLDNDELRRFYAANGDFPRFLSSVKKTIYWRQTYSILLPQELEAWLRLVFWHGCDVKLRPCLIIRLGLACANLRSNDRPLFVRAIVSQIEHGVMHLVNVDHPQITVLLDCDGLSPLGFPMQIMRSCAILLQDHYPRRLGCLMVIRLPRLAQIITQTLFQVLKPATRKKLRIIGDNYKEVLSEFLQTLPVFLGGNCSCSICSSPGDVQSLKDEISQEKPRVDTTNGVVVPSQDLYRHILTYITRNGERVTRAAIIGLIMLLIFTFIILRMCYPENLPIFYRRSNS
ncbi:hypothetical protein RJ639_031854 [Escallonia herrerae]|uniref:CRAL-TRIO domain-containing protein n=1 Tax=Escallonia herrerae TaxID=1293975 RepID=A0AA89BE83_9ASTE|nr:hypothetical protein RJ639_031854 [Escallonia herrerae]